MSTVISSNAYELQMTMNGPIGDMEFAGQLFNSLHGIFLHRCSQGIVVHLHKSPFSWLITEAGGPRPKPLEQLLAFSYIHSHIRHLTLYGIHVLWLDVPGEIHTA